MPVVWINRPQAVVRLHSGRLQIEYKEDERDITREVPLHDTEGVVVWEGTHLTSAVLWELASRSIPLCLIDGAGQWRGSLLPASPAHGQWRDLHHRRAGDRGFCTGIAARIVAAKTHNQRRVLQRLRAGRESHQPSPAAELAAHDDDLRVIEAASQRCLKSGDVDSIRGMEGAASARYFAAWARFLPSAFPFERRSRRPPHNAVNACLSFAATMLHHEMVAAIAGIGLDPALGCLHAIEDGRWSLALDLIEPFRPALSEALSLDCFSRGMLSPQHFHPKAGGIYLNRDGRSKFILQYERRMEREFVAEHTGMRTSLRAQIHEQARMFKAALNDLQAFNPFKMN
jgi:CRISPR-associated protein Cas1